MLQVLLLFLPILDIIGVIDLNVNLLIVIIYFVFLLLVFIKTKYDSGILYAIALLFIIFCIFSVFIQQVDYAEKFVNWSFLFMVAASVLGLVENRFEYQRKDTTSVIREMYNKIESLMK